MERSLNTIIEKLDRKEAKVLTSRQITLLYTDTTTLKSSNRASS
ncbi:hypothetical protein [Methanohalophilus sp.]|nr:hypothetical protein [Methanohalophilus sp.]